MPYQIKDWDKYYENDRSRQRDKCSFVCIPNKQDGMGLTHILCEKDGTAILGVFLLIVEACSRHPRPRQGWLTDDGDQMGRPWLLSEMAIRWRRTEKEIERALQVLTETRVGWLSPPTNHQVTADSPPDNQEGKGKEEKGMEGNGKEHTCLSFSEFWDLYQKKVGKEKAEKAYSKVKENDRDTIKEKLPQYVQATPDVQYRKDPTTWLNGKCWNDEIVKKGETDGEKRLRELSKIYG